MRSAELNKRLEFQALTETPDGHGGFTKTWATHFKKWAKVAPEKWGESFVNDQDFSTITGSITVRCDEQTKRINSSYRALFGGRVLEIKGFANDNESSREIILSYLERT